MVTELEKQTEIREDRSLKFFDYQSTAVAQLFQVVSVALSVAAGVAAAGAAGVDAGAGAAGAAAAAATAAADYQMNSGAE